MTPALLAASAAGVCLGVAVVVLLAARRPADLPPSAAPPAPWRRALRQARHAAGTGRRRLLICALTGLVIWALTGWPIAGLAVVAAGIWLPWLLGSARVVQDRIEVLEALEAWCRRMADTLAGGGAIGLAQAVVTTAPRADDPIADAVRELARRVQTDQGSPSTALREFADAVDDRTGDAVAAALLIALHQQSTGVAPVLRQLADGVARDVRARREIEAARAESRQSIRMLLLIQTGLLVLLALVPSFAAPYGTATGQVVMAVLLAGTGALLVWMRKLSLGRPAPRFLGSRLGAG